MNIKAFDKMAASLQVQIRENQIKAKNAKESSLQLYYEGRQYALHSSLLMLKIAIKDFQYGTYDESEDAG